MLFLKKNKMEADWQADQVLEQKETALDGGETAEGLPPAMTNILTQEANMTPVQAPMGDMSGGADMDVGTPDGMAAAGQWNAPPAMQ